MKKFKSKWALLWKIWSGDLQVHVVQSRDSGPISAHLDFDEAKLASEEQALQEAMSGITFPSVYVVSMQLD